MLIRISIKLLICVCEYSILPWSDLVQLLLLLLLERVGSFPFLLRCHDPGHYVSAQVRVFLFEDANDLIGVQSEEMPRHD